MPDSLVAYNPSDTWQAHFLQTLRTGESGGNYSVGYGQTDLSGAPVDSRGFPQWSGKTGPAGISHAAGAYQFQPGTWARIADKYNLNFRNRADQDAAAWYLAQEDYTQRTGRSLESDLQSGSYGSIASALKSTWTSISKSGLAQGMAAELAPGPSGGSLPSPGQWITDPLGAAGQLATSYFIRGAMVLVGIAVLLVALWALLSRSNALPDAIKIGE